MEQGVSFGDYRFEPGTGRLWSGGREIRLTLKASAVLKELVTHAGQPVAKEDLFATVWSGTAVSDDALTSCVHELRKALEDHPRQPRFIETRHRRGYRFVAPLSSATPDDRHDSSPQAPDTSAMAVLPFADMSPGRDLDYLCEGLVEEVINALTHIDGLRVVARTASFQFRSIGADIRQIGRQLSVGVLLAGSVRKAGERLRVTVQLVEVATGYHRWSERFDCLLEDVFAVQDEIAGSIAMSVRGNVLSCREKQPGLWPQPAATAAFEYHPRGRHHVRSRTRLERRKVPCFSAASTQRPR
jgi:TolB-like protein